MPEVSAKELRASSGLGSLNLTATEVSAKELRVRNLERHNPHVSEVSAKELRVSCSSISLALYTFLEVSAKELRAFSFTAVNLTSILTKYPLRN